MEKAYVLVVQQHRFSDLNLCAAGYSATEPGHCYGPAARPVYILHYILSGKGIFQADGKTWHLQAGQGFLLTPNAVTYYEADKQDPWTYCWVGFTGSKAKEFLADGGLDEKHLTYSNPHQADLESIVLRMLEENGLSLSSQFLLESLLMQFFSILMESTPAFTSSDTNTAAYVAEAARYIQANFGAAIQVTDIADHLGLDRSYVYKIFKKELGMSVQEYLIAARISNARELLALGSLSVAEVAQACGYEDVRTFSKLFKRETGMTCSEYKKQVTERIRPQNGTDSDRIEES